MEEWKWVPDYENLYQISNLGRIRSLLTNKILKPSFDRYGYARFSATKSGKQKTLRIHRIVMIAFNPKDGNWQVNHIDGDKTNNKLSNLEWCNDSENKKHAYSLGLMRPGNQYTNNFKQDLPRYKLKSTNLN